MAVLYIVATPIGNLGDVTMRALETLRKVSLVACEDTRRTLTLLTHFEISVRLCSCRAQNEAQAARRVLAVLRSGGDVAYCSDAGTPGISDPGAVLVRSVTEAGFEAVPLPGACAFSALVSVAGCGGKTVTFEGFLSPKEGRRKSRLKELLERGEAFVVYESPFRILKLLSNLADFDSMRSLCLGREMTKAHEQYLRGTAAELSQTLQNMQEIKGEFALYVSAK
jgi:16S rRNA (cytidine1402-2'-O)-methyltransferase